MKLVLVIPYCYYTVVAINIAPMVPIPAFCCVTKFGKLSKEPTLETLSINISSVEIHCINDSLF